MGPAVKMDCFVDTLQDVDGRCVSGGGTNCTFRAALMDPNCAAIHITRPGAYLWTGGALQDTFTTLRDALNVSTSPGVAAVLKVESKFGTEICGARPHDQNAWLNRITWQGLSVDLSSPKSESLFVLEKEVRPCCYPVLANNLGRLLLRC